MANLAGPGELAGDLAQLDLREALLLVQVEEEERLRLARDKPSNVVRGIPGGSVAKCGRGFDGQLVLPTTPDWYLHLLHC